MVIYNSGDSDLLIQTFSENLKSSKEIFDKINQGTQHLNSVIDSGTLSGAAYRAGQSLFQTYISPMIEKLNSAISDIQNDLNSYKKVDQAVRAEGSHLDETQLMQKLENTKKLIQLIEQKIEEDKKVVQKFMSSGFEGVAKGLAELPGLDGQLDNLKSLKHDYEKKINALQTFSSSTSPLFIDSLQAFKYALEGVAVINQSRAGADGTISFPAGTNMSWNSNLQALGFSSKLKKKNKKEPKIEIRTRKVKKEPNGMYPDSAYMMETIYEVYVDGKLDKAKTDAFNWMMTKQQLFGSLHTLGDFILVNDIYSLVTGKDWLSGDKTNRLEAAGWLALTAIPASKLSKIAKKLKAGNKLLKGVDLSAKDLKILREAGYFDEVVTKESIKVAQTPLKAEVRFNESAIGDYTKQMTGNYTQKDVNELTKLTTHNANSNTALLGKFEQNSVKSYEQIAYENGFTYFDAGNNGWSAMANMDTQLAYNVNEQFLKEQIQSGKEFVLTNNPDDAMKLYNNSILNGAQPPSYSLEMKLLKDSGYTWENFGNGTWKAVKK